MSEVKTLEQSNGYPPDHDYVAHIKRLEETVSEYVQMYHDWRSKNSELEKENERLRGALKSLSTYFKELHPETVDKLIAAIGVVESVISSEVKE